MYTSTRRRRIYVHASRSGGSAAARYCSPLYISSHLAIDGISRFSGFALAAPVSISNEGVARLGYRQAGSKRRRDALSFFSPSPYSFCSFSLLLISRASERVWISQNLISVMYTGYALYIPASDDRMLRALRKLHGRRLMIKGASRRT